jgi:PAS domain S-box-containing protein
MVPAVLRGQTAAITLSTLAALALIVNAAFTVVDVRRIAKANAWVSHTHDVLGTLQAVRSSLLDAETGQRGFIITGDPAYLEPYLAGVNAVSERLEDLAELIRDNPAQQQRISAMKPVIARHLSTLERNLTLRKSGPDGFEAARNAILTNEDKRAMDKLRAMVDEMVSQEDQLLGDRLRAAAVASRGAVVATLLGLGVSLVLVAAALGSFRSRARERERAAARLYEEKERFRTTLTSIGDAVIVTDGEGRITMMNPTAGSVTGWDDDAVGRPLDEVFHIVNEHTRLTVEHPVAKVLREGMTVGLANHTVLIRRDGTEVPIDDSGAPMHGEGGRVTGVVLVFRDIRERREAERELQRRADLLKEQNRRKDEFLAILSHELRNPLAPIRNAVLLLKETSALGDEAWRYVHIVDRQVEQMTRLVNDLLDVSRIAEGKVQLNREPVSLRDAVRRTVEDHRGLFQSKEVAVEVHDTDGPVWVEADATRLVQVVGNLIQNAAKFSNPRGRVLVQVTAEATRAVLRVSDDGAGMDQATVGKLFQPFMQAESTLARAGGGLGLGLALARKLVELHQGTVEASSKGIGKGSEFVVTLPLAQHVKRRPPTAQALARVPLRILVIEDNEDAAEMLRDVLEHDGHQVVVVHDGWDGVDAALEREPDVVFCDIGLPGLDGYEVATRLRAAGLRARLVALTGYATSDDAERAFSAGFDDHIGKPPDPEKLAGALASAAESRAPDAPAPHLH